MRAKTRLEDEVAYGFSSDLDHRYWKQALGGARVQRRGREGWTETGGTRRRRWRRTSARSAMFADLAARVAFRARPGGGGGDHWPGNQMWWWLALTKEVGKEWAYV
ncbi:hypothetical protein M6B38_276525 [Iris pallida]|uniref:Uncharacterized protein n=1 Tax=Iris pallida TaxID=29817 RepID=A0AAX6I5H1_IRIPA|nr:hypothetical protein M6B38_276525 [Iris pallida]